MITYSLNINMNLDHIFLILTGFNILKPLKLKTKQLIRFIKNQKIIASGKAAKQNPQRKKFLY